MYEKISYKIMENCVVHIVDILKSLNYTLQDFSEITGYNPSTFSRNKANVLKSKFKKENIPYAITLAFGIDAIILNNVFPQLVLDKINKLLFDDMQNIIKPKQILNVTLNCMELNDWYKIDFDKGIGIVNQLEYLTNMSLRNKLEYKYEMHRSKITNIILNAKIACTCSALLNSSYLINDLKEFLINTFNMKEDVEIYASKIIKKRIYFGELAEIDGIKIINKEFGDDVKTENDYIQDVYYIYMNFCEEEVRNIVLWVHNKEEIRKIKMSFTSNVIDSIVFIYLNDLSGMVNIHYKDEDFEYPYNEYGMLKKISNPEAYDIRGGSYLRYN